MSYLIPRSLMSFPSLGLSSFFDDDTVGLVSNVPNGLSLAEDDKHVYVEVAVPGEIDLNIEPEAETKNGVLHITFTKSPKAQPKKISVKSTT